MSSDMKDARWGLAMAMSQDDDVDWYAMDYVVKEFYLRVAQEQLDIEPETIQRWANEFRSNS